MEPLKEKINGENASNIIRTSSFEENESNEEKELNSSSRLHPQPWCGLHWSTQDTISNFYNYSNQSDKEKSPMCRIAEIARFNKLRHVYDLLDESGPAHKKLFTVKLVLSSDEVYEGSGSSIKRAQQAAAELALQKTKRAIPPEKIMRRKKNESQMPYRVLQNVCRALQFGEPHFLTFPITPSSPLTTQVQNNIDPAFLENFKFQMLNQYGSFPQVFYVTIARIRGEDIAFGCATTIVEAKADAAAKALCCLGPTIQSQFENFNKMIGCNPENPENDFLTDIPKHKQKSVISDVHEKAHQMKMNVIFEVVNEDGPPHNREYCVRCAFVTQDQKVTAEAIGKGRKKKEAQQEACSQLLKSLNVLIPENNPVFIANSLCRSQKKLASLSREPKRKTIVKDKKMDPQYGHQINPVSRLIQVLQTKNRSHPTFELVGEHGQSRYKEFVIRVTCGDETVEGRGPNKRLAKRAAAENMLALIGYVKPLPQPGKSLLKKKSFENDNGSKEKFDSVPEEQKQSNNLNENAGISPKSVESRGSESKEVEIVEHQQNEMENHLESADSGKRRVTFNNQVQACPPPGDQNYPTPVIAPLKVEVIFEGKIRRMRRIKESRRSLTTEQKQEIAELSVKALEMIQENLKNDKSIENMAHHQLEMISASFKFGVQYTHLPNDGCREHFALVSLGFEDPAVFHGVGKNEAEAENFAAQAALEKLTKFGEVVEEKKCKTSFLNAEHFCN